MRSAVNLALRRCDALPNCARENGRHVVPRRAVAPWTRAYSRTASLKLSTRNAAGRPSGSGGIGKPPGEADCAWTAWITPQCWMLGGRPLSMMLTSLSQDTTPMSSSTKEDGNVVGDRRRSFSGSSERTTAYQTRISTWIANSYSCMYTCIHVCTSVCLSLSVSHSMTYMYNYECLNKRITVELLW